MKKKVKIALRDRGIVGEKGRLYHLSGRKGKEKRTAVINAYHDGQKGGGEENDQLLQGRKNQPEKRAFSSDRGGEG